MMEFDIERKVMEFAIYKNPGQPLWLNDKKWGEETLKKLSSWSTVYW